MNPAGGPKGPAMLHEGNHRTNGKNGSTWSWYTVLSCVLIFGCMLAGVVALFFAWLRVTGRGLRGDEYGAWWLIMLPLMVAVAVVFLVFTFALLVWLVRAAMLVFSFLAQSEEDRTRTPRRGDMNPDNEVDVLMKTAKGCFVTHMYMSLFLISAFVLCYKLAEWESMSLIQALIPTLILGSIHILLAIFFKEPDVDSERSMVIGLSIIFHCIVFHIKVDLHAPTPWYIIFLPSWLTFAYVIFSCSRILHGDMVGEPEDDLATVNEREPLLAPRILFVDRDKRGPTCVGLIMWSAFWTVALAMLCLRWDAGDKDPDHFDLVFLFVALGWILFGMCIMLPLGKVLGRFLQTLFRRVDTTPAANGRGARRV